MRCIHLTSSYCEGKKLDVSGHEFYCAGAWSIHVVCMRRYKYTLWEQLSKFRVEVPEDKKTRGFHIQNEGTVFAKQLLNCTQRILDIIAETIISAVYLRRHAWLCSTDFHQDTKSYTEDLFEGGGLFSSIMYSILQEMDKSIEASWMLGILFSTKFHQPHLQRQVEILP